MQVNRHRWAHISGDGPSPRAIWNQPRLRRLRVRWSGNLRHRARIHRLRGAADTIRTRRITMIICLPVIPILPDPAGRVVPHVTRPVEAPAQRTSMLSGFGGDQPDTKTILSPRRHRHVIRTIDYGEHKVGRRGGSSLNI